MCRGATERWRTWNICIIKQSEAPLIHTGFEPSGSHTSTCSKVPHLVDLFSTLSAPFLLRFISKTFVLSVGVTQTQTQTHHTHHLTSIHIGTFWAEAKCTCWSSFMEQDMNTVTPEQGSMGRLHWKSGIPEIPVSSEETFVFYSSFWVPLNSHIGITNVNLKVFTAFIRCFYPEPLIKSTRVSIKHTSSCSFTYRAHLQHPKPVASFFCRKWKNIKI